jgi:hypothetical protein
MRRVFPAFLAGTMVAVLFGTASAQTPVPGQEEFGLTERELSQRVEKVEALIAQCMREQGFQYIAVDFKTVKRAMLSDKSLPGVDEEEFIEKHGYGISTMYTGEPPQLSTGYSPAKVGLGRRNVEIFQALSPADQVAYMRALTGEHPDATFAIGVESENFSRCDGCTRKAVEAVFDAKQLDAAYHNPLDELIAKDPRMRAALQEYAKKMRAKGFDIDNPETIETKVRERLDAITDGGTVPLADLSPEQLKALEELQDYERGVAQASFELEQDLLEPVEERVEREIYARRVE